MKVHISVVLLLLGLGLIFVESRNIQQGDDIGNPGGEKENKEGSSGGQEMSNKKGKGKGNGDEDNRVGDGCSDNACAEGSTCVSAESSSSVVHDTGLPYTCRCPRNMYGIFCSLPRAQACENCVGSSFYCQPTNMHWSGRFCYNSRTFSRILDGDCGRWDFSCDGNSRCVAPVSLCDGYNDCVDGTDETGPHCAVHTPFSSGMQDNSEEN